MTAKLCSPVYLAAVLLFWPAALRCGERDDLARRILSATSHSPGSLVVMTRNLYVGTDVTKVLEAESPEDIPLLVTLAFMQLQSTAFPVRAAAIAEEIATARPHLVALQEVSLIRIQSPGDAVLGGETPAEDVFLDYLAILMAELEARGMDYRVAGRVRNADVELPMIASAEPLTFDDVRLTDFDVVLARGDVEVSNVVEKNFEAALEVPGTPIVIPRGYVAVDARAGRGRYRFVNTHLEPFLAGGLPVIQEAQARELLAALEDARYPVVLAGDLNSPAPEGSVYRLFLSEGFRDAWLRNAVPREGPGNTFGHAADLRNEEVNLTERIDFVLVRNPGPNGRTLPIGPVLAYLTGDEPEDRVVNDTDGSLLWPSDHAGIVAALRVPRSLRDLFERRRGRKIAAGGR